MTPSPQCAIAALLLATSAVANLAIAQTPRATAAQPRSGPAAGTKAATLAARGKQTPAATPAGAPSFKVARVYPSGTGQSQHASIRFVFSTDVVSTKALDSSRAAAGVLQFDPSLEGYAEWTSPRVLTFVPQRSLRAGTRYAMRLTPDLQDAGGRKLTGPNEFTFETQPLELHEVEQVGFTKDRRVIVSLHFSDDVSPAELEKSLSFRSGDQVLGWKPQKDVIARKIQVETDPLTTDRLTLVLEPGLRGAAGPLGIREREERPVALEFKLLPDKLTAGWDKDRATLSLHFSNPVSMDDIKKYISISPDVAFEVTSDYETLKLNGPFHPETRYTVMVKPGLLGTNGELLFREVSLSTWVPAMKGFMELKEAGGHLSSAGRMRLRVRSTQVPVFRVKATRLYDNNLVFFANNHNGRDKYAVEQFGHSIGTKTFSVKEPAKVSTTEVDLHEVLGAKPEGIYYVQVQAEQPAKDEKKDSAQAQDFEDYESDEYSSWNSPYKDGEVIIVSNLGITGKRAGNEATVWVTALDSAKPVADAKVRAYSSANQQIGEAQTDANGIAVIKGLGKSSEKTADIIVAESGADVCYLDLSKTLEGASETDDPDDTERNDALRDYLRKGYEAFVSPERGVYRPGELVHLLGHVRGKDSAVPAAFPLELQIERPDGRKWDPLPVTASSSGTLVTELRIPEFAPTGLYTANIQLGGTAERSLRKKDREHRGMDDEEEADDEPELLGKTEFRVEDYLPNRLKVEATAADVRFSRAIPLSVSIHAQEMFGQPAAGRAVTGTALFRTESFSPTGYAGFTFGDLDSKYEPLERKLDEQTTDQNGGATITVELPKRLPASALRAEVQVTVKDIGGRSVTSLVERKVDPVEYYVGAKSSAETFAQTGKVAEFELIAVRPDGTAVETAELTGTISRVRYNSILKRDDGSYRYVTKRELETVREFTATLRDRTTSVTWTPSEPGSYLLRVASTATGSLTALPFHVSSPNWGEQPWSMEKPEQLELVLDKKSYAPGDKARLLIKSPFAGTLLLTTEQDNVLTSQVITMAHNTHEIELPVDAAMAPNFYCVASVVRAVKPEEKWLPHRAFGSANVRLSSDHRRIAIDVNQPEETRPQQPLTVSVSAKDANTSQPIAAELVVWAVDEGILSLTDFETPDPLDFFTAARRLLVTTADFFAELMPEITERAGEKSAVGGDEAAGRKLSPIHTERVKPTVIWKGIVKTDDQGSATVTLDVPQFMGQLRVIAVAAADQRMGSGDSNVYVRNPLMIKESLPRFLAPGDDVTIPFVLYNNTDTPQPVQFTVLTSGPLSLSTNWTGAATDSKAASRQTEAIAARGMLTLPVRMRVADSVGPAEVHFAGTMGAESYADTVRLPVRPAMPFTSQSGVETVNAGESKPLTFPQTQFVAGTSTGTLVVSSMPTVHLASAIKYLYYYKYGCLEQTVSSGFPLLFVPELADLITSGEANRYVVESKVQWCVDRLLSMQLSNGGFVMWQGQRDPWDWGTIYAVHFLVEAKKAGYDVSETALDEALDYLRANMGSFSDDTSLDTMTERCYAAYVVAAAGKRNLERQEALFEARARLTPTARALLASSFAMAGNAAEARTLMAEPVTFQTTETRRQTGGILSSPARELALLLSAALDTNSGAAEVPQLVDRLQKLRGRDGHWGTTQDNAFAIWALGKYTKKISGTPQDFTGSIRGAARSFDFQSSESLHVSMEDVTNAAVVEVSGQGRAYLAWTVEGVPTKLDTTSVSRGISVERIFLDRKNRRLDPRNLQQGQLVVVEVKLQSARSLKNVVIEDLLPAGLEIENANLATSEQISGDSSEHTADDSDEGAAADEENEPSDAEADNEPSDTQGAGGLNIQRTDARDDRMLAFVDLDGSGSAIKGTFRYAARAVSQGTFVLPPVQASCMYDPEIQARSGAGTVVVLPKP
ncbi:MAG: MG2 domain-containing protein [Candidatus Sumerlaeaceae bacterium]